VLNADDLDDIATLSDVDEHHLARTLGGFQRCHPVSITLHSR
jgi:hypothetical protein